MKTTAKLWTVKFYDPKCAGSRIGGEPYTTRVEAKTRLEALVKAGVQDSGYLVSVEPIITLRHSCGQAL